MPRRPQNFDGLLEYFWKVENRFEEMERPRFERVPTDIPGARFEYCASDWVAIDAEISKLPLFNQVKVSDPSRHWRLWLEGPARDYFLAKASAPPVPLSERMRRWEKVWQKIDELQETIADAAEAHFGGVEPPDGTVEEIDQQLASLHEFRLVVARRASGLGRTAISEGTVPTHSARVEYFHGVLLTWMALGGKLRLPSDGLSGPLARFFFAAVGPVMGEEQPSPSSLRDIVAAFLASFVTIAKNTKALLEVFESSEVERRFWESYLHQSRGV